jgi:uncharacterized protein (DUF1684 family)
MTDEHEHHDHDHDHDHDHAHEHHEHVPVEYKDAVEGFRLDKDEFFKTQPGSPIPEAERDDFDGLPYFPVDEALAFEDRVLEPYTGDEPSNFQIPTSDGQLRPAHRAGTFEFELDGATRRLTAYVLDGGEPTDSVFVPFLDATSGQETYGAGRYLDLEAEPDGSYALDFNLAYHPYCVYAESYSCPLTPAENRLPIRIEAGERLPAETSASTE